MIVFWKVVLIAVMVLFFPAAVIVTIKGFGDVLKMFIDLDAPDTEAPEPSPGEE